MGNDGGSIPRRDELVKTAKKEKKKNPIEQDRVNWNLCTLSKEPLQDPIVVDKLGFFMNKEVLLKSLLLKTVPPELNYIRSIKDVYTVHLKRNPEWKPGCTTMFCPFVCPVSLEPASGQDKFVALVPCGCVVSLKSYQEIPSTECIVCGKTIERVIYVNQSPDRLASSKKALEEEIAEERARRKAKKKAKRETSDDVSNNNNGDDNNDGNGEPAKKKKKKADGELSLPPPPSGANSDIYKSLFKPSNEGDKMNGNDLFLGKSGKAGVL